MPLLIPNFHVALIHFPIALLVIGVLIELITSFAWRDSSSRSAGRWMILFAALLGWPAVYSGAYAVRTAAGDAFANSTWSDIRANSPRLSDAATWETLRTHIVINASVVAAVSVVVLAWLVAGARFRRRIYWPCLLLLLVATAGAGVGAWQGGELVYWHDVTHVKDSPGPDAHAKREVSFAPVSVLPPLDAHVTLAGLATGLSLLAWGVAARTRRALVPLEAGGVAALPGTTAPAGDSPLVDPQRDRIFAAFQQSTVEVVAAPPSAVLGLIAGCMFIVTALFGLWSIADGYESWSPRVLLTAIVDGENAVGGLSRRLAHWLAGLLLVVVAIALGIVGGRSRTRLFPMMVGCVLFALLVVQAWLGVLLLLDSNAGAVTRFN